MKSMKTVVFHLSFVARLGRYAKTKSNIKYIRVGRRTSKNYNKHCFNFLESTFISILVKTTLILLPPQGWKRHKHCYHSKRWKRHALYCYQNDINTATNPMMETTLIFTDYFAAYGCQVADSKL